MKSRTILAAVLALGTGTAAMAQVGVDVETPRNRGGVDLDIRVGSDAKADMSARDAWVGRTVYSNDGSNVGEVAALSGNDLFVDIGGFLGLGETRVLLANDQIDEVRDDRIVLKLSESEVQNLPPVEAPAAQ
jgi:hypothetical protein